MSDHAIMVASLVSLCDRATINTSDGIEKAIKCIVCLSVRYIDRVALLEKVVPGAYVDWNYVDNSQMMLLNKQNLFGDSDVWLKLLHYLNFGSLDIEALEFRRLYPPIWTLYQTMEEHVGHNSTKWNFGDTCKVFFLSNLLGIPFNYATERYVTNRLAKDSHVLCRKIMEAMAEERHEAGVYLNCMEYLLNIGVFDTESLDTHIQHYRQTTAVQQAAWSMKNCRVQNRPSIRTVLANKRSLAGSNASVIESHHDSLSTGVMTFSAFNDLIRCSNSLYFGFLATLFVIFPFILVHSGLFLRFLTILYQTQVSQLHVTPRPHAMLSIGSSIPL
jgi:hypothetical protein